MPGSAKRKAADDGNSDPPKRQSRRRPATAKPDVPAVTKNMASNEVKRASGRRSARAAKKWSEEYLLTSDKSPLIDVDLVKLLANPKAWNCLEEDEKREILSLLPDGTHPNPDGDPEDPEHKLPPLPHEFLRYSNFWRDGVRQFQDDLQGGRYDPKWQRQAQAAVEERAAGKFDDWKEAQFEEFWGQKQKIDRTLAAGESSKVRLETLVKNNVVKVGDIWKFARCIGRGDSRILVEKEVKIIDFDGTRLTFAIPPGQRVLLCGNAATPKNNVSVSESKNGSQRESEKPEFPIIENGRNTSANEDLEIPNSQFTSESVLSVEKPESSLQPGVTDGNTLSPSSPSGLHSHINLLSSLKQFATEMESDDGTKTPIKETHINEATLPIVPKSSTVGGPVTPNDHFTKRHDGHSYSGSRLEYEKVLEDLVFDSGSELSEWDQNFDFDDPSFEWDTYRSQLDTTLTVAGFTSLHTDTDFLKTPERGTKQVEHKNTAIVENVGGGSMTVKADIAEVKPTIEEKQEISQIASHESSDGGEKGPEMQETPTDIVFSGIRGPSSLHNKILQIDGRIKNPPNGNAWKDFRCYRNNQDIGGLWEIRHAWYMKTNF